jgi:hypothetical protein
MKRPNRNAFAKSLLIFSAVMLFSAAVWAGGEPWKGKPYQQWDDKDVERVFLDSPWSRTTTITRTWLPISSKDLPDKIISGSGRSLPTELERSGETSVGGELNFYVFWASSRVMRAASARKSVLHGDKKDLDVEKYATEPQEEIQVLVQSEDMAPFTRKDEKFFQVNAFLQPKKSKQKILPSHIRYERDAKGILVTSALFFFPRKTASGEPTIASDEKSVEFNCNMDGSSLRVNFEPQKMVDLNGPSL